MIPTTLRDVVRRAMLLLVVSQLACTGSLRMDYGDVGSASGNLDGVPAPPGETRPVMLETSSGSCTASSMGDGIYATARHCVMDSAGNPTVTPGESVIRDRDGNETTVREVRYAGGGSPFTSQDDVNALPSSDVAFVRADRDVGTPSTVAPTGEGDVRDGDTLTSYGYGLTGREPDGRPDGTLRTGPIEDVRTGDGRVDGSGGIGSGDSGGPVYNERGEQIGVNSISDCPRDGGGCAERTTTGVARFTDEDRAELERFREDSRNGNTYDGTRSYSEVAIDRNWQERRAEEATLEQRRSDLRDAEEYQRTAQSDDESAAADYEQRRAENAVTESEMRLSALEEEGRTLTEQRAAEIAENRETNARDLETTRAEREHLEGEVSRLDAERTELERRTSELDARPDGDPEELARTQAQLDDVTARQAAAEERIGELEQRESNISRATTPSCDCLDPAAEVDHARTEREATRSIQIENRESPADELGCGADASCAGSGPDGAASEPSSAGTPDAPGDAAGGGSGPELAEPSSEADPPAG
ncbi:MAG: trypsin-like serine protease, partial [Deltaproteobacteria bacterium]|nr:trypsin-like serine protease [Deltaproteobacteria bacterium]